MGHGVRGEFGDDLRGVLERKPFLRELGDREGAGGACSARGGRERGDEAGFLIHVTQRGHPCVT